MKKKPNRLLIVDLAEDASQQFSRIAHRRGYITARALAIDDFKTQLAEFSPTVVLIDLHSVANDGLEHLKALRDQGSCARVILTGDVNGRVLETAKQLAEFLGLPAVAKQRSAVLVDVLSDELHKMRQSQSGLTLEGLTGALENGEIRQHYQPRACFRANQHWPIAEVEAIPCVQLSESRLLMPDDYHSLADAGGLSPGIVNAQLKQVTEQVAEWRKRKLALNVVVKLPASSLQDPGFPELLHEMLQGKKLKAPLLTLAVSEANVMNISTTALNSLCRLKSMGFRLAVDEFGSSYSSIEQVYRLQFDELKIDRALVLEARGKGHARTIIEATVALAQKLGMSVCADGVDSRRTMQFLGKIGCNKAQGDYISCPVDASELEGRVNDWNVAAEAG